MVLQHYWHFLHHPLRVSVTDGVAVERDYPAGCTDNETKSDSRARQDTKAAKVASGDFLRISESTSMLAAC